MYNRRVLAGEFAVVNKHLLRDLTQRGLWNASLRNQIMADQGSVQRLDIPQDLKVCRSLRSALVYGIPIPPPPTSISIRTLTGVLSFF